MLIQMHKEKTEDEAIKAISIDSKTYCKLGHFHLLLENYSKGNLLYLLISHILF